MNLTIKKLNQDILKDYLHFFDDIAFCDNPSWSACYCSHFYYSEAEDLDGITSEHTRACVVKRTKEGTHNGFIAYVDEEPVGWINAGVKDNYTRVVEIKEIPNQTDKKVGAIVCFVIDHNHRGKGIATALLNEACKDFEDNGYDYVEAYPFKSPDNAAENYHGPLNMYLKNGFEITTELETMNVVRRMLK